MKLTQFIAQALELPRREATKVIESGEVIVNGSPNTQYSLLVSPKDNIQYKGKKLKVQDKRAYIIFYKPRGIITSQQGLASYYEEIGKKNLKYAGRLDKDSEGLLILSNDGDFINKISHPSYRCQKTYKVWVSGYRNNNQIQKLQKLCKAKLLKSEGKDLQLIEIILSEGKNRQIRRLCSQVGLTVEKLKRLSIGQFNLGNLKPGQWQSIDTSKLNSI